MKRKEGRKGGKEEGSKEGRRREGRAPLIVWNGIINSWFRKGFHVSPLYTGERERDPFQPSKLEPFIFHQFPSPQFSSPGTPHRGIYSLYLTITRFHKIFIQLNICKYRKYILFHACFQYYIHP